MVSPRRQVPNAQRVVVGAGDHVATIGRDRHGTDRAGMALERADQRDRRVELDLGLKAEAKAKPLLSEACFSKA